MMMWEHRPIVYPFNVSPFPRCSQCVPMPKAFPRCSQGLLHAYKAFPESHAQGIPTAFPRCFRAQRVPVIPFFLKLPRCSRGVTVAEVFSMCSCSTSARSQGVPNVGTPSYSVPVQRQPVPKVFPMRSHAQDVPTVLPRPSPYVPVIPFPRCSKGLSVPETFKAFPCPRYPHGVRPFSSPQCIWTLECRQGNMGVGVL